MIQIPIHQTFTHQNLPCSKWLSKLSCDKVKDETCDYPSANQLNSHLRFCQVNGLFKVSHKAQIFSIHKIMLILYINPVNVDTA